MSRKLASVQRIKDIRPIEGADRIEIVQVLNWDCVAKKGEFNVGDWVIYFEIDSLLPDIPMFEFLKGSSWSQKLNKYKISTHTFRNQISQGLVIPYDQLQELMVQINGEVDFRKDYAEGEDLTELLKIEKYEPPVSNGSLGEIVHHEWYIPKTDEERIQVCAEDVLPTYMNSDLDDWYESIKLDGTSCTVGLFDDAFLIGGRNQWYKGNNMYTETIKKYAPDGDIKTVFENYRAINGIYVAFQGELCGPGIQGNKLGLKEKEWFVFNVFVSKTGKNGTYTKCDLLYMLKLCEEFGFKHVPLVDFGDKFNFKETDNIDQTVKNLLEYVDGFKYKYYFDTAAPDQLAEGIVFRTEEMTHSFKVVSNKYLLKGGN